MSYQSRILDDGEARARRAPRAAAASIFGLRTPKIYNMPFIDKESP
jgi:hypothetical protein